MKQLFFLLIIALTLFACPNPADEPWEPPENTPAPLTPPTSLSEIKFALYDGSTLQLWDGNTLIDAYTGIIRQAGHRKLSIDNAIYYFDEFANSTYSAWLNIIPDAITVRDTQSASRAVVYTDDIYTLETIDANEAYALGALPRPYTRIYENAIEVGIWYENQWETSDVITSASGHIVIIDTVEAYHNITNGKIIDTVYEGGIMLHDMGTEHGFITDETGTYEVTWEMNHFDHSVWQKAGDTWYTENGYEWTATGGVISNANAMYAWNSFDTYPDSYDAIYGERPYLLPAGVKEIDIGEYCLYWIETVTGQLYKYTPLGDSLELVTEIYEGADTRMEAIPYYNTLDPELIDNEIWYHENGMIKYIDLDTLEISIFSGDAELIVWE